MKPGPKPGTGGRPKKSDQIKKLEGTPGGYSEIKSIAASLRKNFEASEYMTAEQAEKISFRAKEIFDQTMNYIHAHGGEEKVPLFLVEQYSMQGARWLQCQEALSKFGLTTIKTTVKNTQNTEKSPFAEMALAFSKDMTQIWYNIELSLQKTGKDEEEELSPMERLLRSKGG